MGFLGMSGDTWKKIGGYALKAAPIVAAPFTGGASLLALGAGTGALSGAMGGGGWKGALTGGALGAIPGGAGVGGLAKGALRPALGAGLKQAGLSFGKQAAIGLGTGAAAKLAGGGGGGGNVYQNAMPQGAGGGGAGGGQGFWGTWGPVVGQGVGAVAGGIAAKKAQAGALKRSPEELAALKGAQGVAGTASGVAGSLLRQSKPYIEKPANYYQQLLGGNRAAMTQAVAPGIASATDVYRGAERNLDRTGVRGAARDVASADLGRQRAGQIASLTTGVQPWAAGQLAGLGTGLLGQATPLYGTAGNIYTNLLGRGYENRTNAMVEGREMGKTVGGLVRDIGEAWPKGTKKTTPPLLPSRQTTPTVGYGYP